MSTTFSEALDHGMVRAQVERLSLHTPKLTDLSAAQLEQIAQFVVAARLRDDLERLAAIARIDYEEELKTFLGSASRTGSWGTITAYAHSLARLDDWSYKRGIFVLELSPRQVDEYIYYLRNIGRSPASIRLDVAGASSFFSFLERRFEVIRNPFRGTRARPAVVPTRKLVIPTKVELEVVLGAADPVLRAAITCMSGRGFRVGALPSLCIDAGRFTAWSKGREIFGLMPELVTEAIATARLNPRRPFSYYPAKLLSRQVKHLCSKLSKAGKVRDAFSAHDLRHYFAVNEYETNRDIYRLKVLLCHSSISTTERYLQVVKML